MSTLNASMQPIQVPPGAAVSVLASCWVHGEELRRWHNLDTQIGTEGEKANASGGVLNPALLIMTKETEEEPT
ncbi:MAG: hypothetical protein M0010_09365 [Actinomycetota bacterium]|nr:hypothetical protein [Actinomycetota bacterium]